MQAVPLGSNDLPYFVPVQESTDSRAQRAPGLGTGKAHVRGVTPPMETKCVS